MFRKSNAQLIKDFMSQSLKQNDLAVFYLGVSGLIARTSNQTVIFDPAGFLKNEEVAALNQVNLMLFTHDHLDHFNSGKTQDIFKSTNAHVLAEAKVANKLKDKIPTDKLTSAESAKTYTFDEITIRAVQGIHRGPIMLYQIKMSGITVFHGGDSGYVPLKDYASDVAFLPVGRMSPTASPENAFKMVADIGPQVALAMHGSEKQKLQFQNKIKESMPQTSVLIMGQFTSKTLPLFAVV